MDSLLREELPTIVSNGAFGKNLKYVSFEFDKDHVGQDQYKSTVLFGTVTTSEESQYPVVIKLKLRDESLRVKFKIDLHFHNEITMYARIIPFLLKCHRSIAGIGEWPTLARYFYGRNKCGEFFDRDLIVLENVNPLGFRLSEARTFLDYDHLVIALRALAKASRSDFNLPVQTLAIRKSVYAARSCQCHSDLTNANTTTTDRVTRPNAMMGRVDGTIADMTAAGAFGPDSRLVSFELEGLHTELDQFASCVLYGTATVDERDGRRRSHRLVFKFKHPTQELRDFYNNDNQFHNETLFYERIAPFLLASGGSWRNGVGTGTPTLCRYFYGRNDCGEQAHRDVIVLENETDRGYRTAVTSHRLTLEFDHLIVALRTLARFHGLSYRAKYEDSVKFKETVADVKETQWSKDGEWIFHPRVLQGLFSVATDRLKERHFADGGCGDNELEWINKFQSELLEDAMQALRRIVVPVEPIAVLCHGDFNRNNLLFRYDDGGRPVDALPYDMATVRYGSPVLDLSFFVYMNTDRRTRDDHWDALLDAYCTTLAAEAGDVPVPDRDQLDAEMREYGFYGLVHVSYFARVMLEETTHVESEEFIDADEFKMLSLLIANGGDTATEWVADAVQHFIRCKYACRAPDSSTAANEDGKPIKI